MAARSATMLLRLWLLAVALLLTAAAVHANMFGSQSITPHDYQSLGRYLAASAPSCGYPYASLDISRITAVQLMDVASECGTCLRIETSPSNYIEDGESIGLPGVAMATNFAATTSEFDPLPTTSVALERRGQKVRYIHVLAVDTGGRGLDLAQVSFTALFGQSMSPMPASWFPVEAKYCQDIWRNETKRQTKGPTSMDDVPIMSGRSTAPPGLGPVGDIDEPNAAAHTRLSSICAVACMLAALLFLA